jgi:magnesium-transporting ATPase (P-type)
MGPQRGAHRFLWWGVGGDGTVVDIAAVRDCIQQHFEEFSSKGFRTLGGAYRNMGSESRIGKDDEAGMTFLGFLVLFDPPRADTMETIASLKKLGVALVLPFLPLLPKQILLTNILTDVPEMTIATDGANDEMVDHPRRWDIRIQLTADVVPAAHRDHHRILYDRSGNGEDDLL